MNTPTLILGDGSPTISAIADFLARRYTVSLGPTLSSETQLESDELKGYASILLVPTDVFPALHSSLIRAILDFVEHGGILVALPFLAWSVKAKTNHLLDRILPVECSEFFEDKAVTWSLNSIPVSWTSIGYFKEERIINFSNVSGEILAARVHAHVYAEDRANGVCAIASWHVGAGSVAYINLCHHTHKPSATSVWDDECARDILAAFLGTSDLDSKALHFNGTTGVETYWGDHNLLNRGDPYPNPKARSAIFSPRQGSEGIRRIQNFYRSHTNPVITEDGGMLFGGDERLEYFESDYGLPKKKYLRLIEKVPQNPFLFISDNDFGSMSRPERLYVCRALLDILSDNDRFSKLFRCFMYHGDYVGRSTYEWCANQAEKWKGRALERFARFFFKLLQGVEVQKQDYRSPTGEIDLVLRVDPQSPLRQELGNPVFVECKNIESKVDTQSVRSFASKIEEAGVRSGFVLSTNGVTGDTAHDAAGYIRLLKKTRGVNIVSLSFNEIRRILRFHKTDEAILSLYFELY